MATLFTLDEKGRKQRICNVICNPKLGDDSDPPIDLICANFTRDPSILRLNDINDTNNDGSGQINTNDLPALSKHNQYKRMTIFVDDDEINEKKNLMNFSKYLKDRKKAAICNYKDPKVLRTISANANGSTVSYDIILLPPTFDNAELIQCYFIPSKKVAPVQVQGQGQVQASSTANVTAKSASIKAPPDSVSTATATAAASGGGGHGGVKKPVSLLASLASRVSSGVSIRMNMQATAAKAAAIIANNYIDKIESNVKERLLEFDNDVTLNEVRLEPMDKDYRYVVR
jgi:hypothetical protein